MCGILTSYMLQLVDGCEGALVYCVGSVMYGWWLTVLMYGIFFFLLHQSLYAGVMTVCVGRVYVCVYMNEEVQRFRPVYVY